ncbi:hypothetical protein MJC1_03879 [Methylocystis sp. MJC1]|jgi:hypothetical protein|uniref:DUF1971 domain-containing protein n=1 Tax=Methylocystis sp. MJC1 TaxID=2654282 RepID=UPI0027D30A54|nr:DUF1971 domain-containing protein [Methylocystis sp. MJC1]KAF2989023.1 hypothetical protein MJC1_03879 [Methylocystis sp. MJC1]
MTAPPAPTSAKPAGVKRGHFFRRTAPRTSHQVGREGVIGVLEGCLRYQVLDPSSEVILEPGCPGLIPPQQPHLMEPLRNGWLTLHFYG